MIQSLIDGGQLRILAGRIRHYEPTPEGVIVTYRPRHTQITEALTVSRVVQCTGAQADYRTSSHSLIAGLRQQSLTLAATVLQSLPVPSTTPVSYTHLTLPTKA